MTGLLEQLVALADELDRRAAWCTQEALQVPVPRSETGRTRVAVLHARASGLQEAAQAARAQAQACAEGAP